MSTKSKHTPGPWTVQRGRNFIQISPVTGPLEVGLEISPETEANARLIAAAPELLDCLKSLLHPREGALNGNLSFVELKRIQDLINKVEGSDSD